MVDSYLACMHYKFRPSLVNMCVNYYASEAKSIFSIKVSQGHKLIEHNIIQKVSLV